MANQSEAIDWIERFVEAALEIDGSPYSARVILFR
jgi:hypothetical protein